MANLSEDIQCVGSDTRPPMLDRTDFASWQQRINFYCRGKENGVNILKSIDEGPYQIVTVRDTLAESTEGVPQFGPERPRVYSDLSPEDKDRYNVDIRATNILLQGLPKDIYTLINHYTDAKDIWDNVKMLLEGSELTDDFEHFRQHKGESIHDDYVWFVTAVKLNRGLRDSNYDQMNQATVQDDRVVVQNVQGRQNRGRGMNPRGESTAGYGGAHNIVGNVNPGQARPGQARPVKCYNCNALDEEQLLFLAGGQDNAFDDDVDEQPVQDLALNVDNVFQADDCDAFDSDVDEAPTTQTMFMANLSSADPVTDKAGPSYDSDIISEVQDHDHYQDAVLVNNSLTADLATYKKQVELYERRAKFELTEREQKINEQLRLVISDRNFKEETLKRELHSIKLQLASTINHNKSMVEEVTFLKKDFKQKENKYLEDFLDMKSLKGKLEDRLIKQDQSLQTVHMLCRPKLQYNELNKVAIGYKNPLCLTRAKQVQPALYNGHEIIKDNHTPAIVHNTEDTLEIVEITKKKINAKMKDPEGQTGSDAGTQDEGQAGSNPDEIFEGQAGPDPGNAGDEVQSIPSPVVHAGSDREHMDLDAVDVSPQPFTEQLDEGFTATAYLKVQENLKLAVDEQVLLEDPASSSGTLSSLQHLKTEVESMVSVTIQQDMSSIPPMTSPTIDLTSRPESPKVHQQFKATTTTTTLPPLPAQQQSTVEAMMMKRIAPLRNRFRDVPKANMKEILHQRMWETESYKTHKDHMQLFKALEKSMNCDHPEELAFDLAEARKKKKKSRESPKTPPGSPPPHPPPTGPSGASGAPGASGSSQVPPPLPSPSSTNQESPSKGSVAPSSPKTAASAEYQAWTTTDIRLRPSISWTPADLEMDEDMTPDEQAQSSDDEDIGKPAWSIPSSDVPVPTNNWASALASNYSPPPEDSLLTQIGDIATFMDWFCKRRGITELKPQDLEGPAFKIVKVFHPDVIHLQYQMEECHKLLTDSVDDPMLRHNVSKPLPLGGPPGQVTIQSNFFFNKDLEYLRYGSRPVLSISKMKAAYYPDAGHEQMVPDQFWIDEECKYDIAAMYGISHWWFQRQRFYIDRHTSEGDRGAVRTHMWILSVVRIKVFSMCGYDYMKKIVLRRADLNEHVIAERDFKYLYPSDFEDLYLLNLQGHLNHLPPKDKKILTTIVNQWTRHLDRYRVQMLMRFNEIHKFSYGTLQQIDEALDYRVKEFRINMMNPCLNTRFWTRKDADRSKAFMFAIQRRLKTRRIFRNLKSFVGGRVREGDYRLLKRTE
nr:hypothetical protein [Tanacetum cinerariifolium]